MVKLKKSLLISLLPFLLVTIFHGCSGVDKGKVSYDRDIKNFKFYLPPKKVSLGLLYFSDSRSEFDRLGEDFVSTKKPIREFSTKLAEELLLQNNTFSSITIISPFELPDLTNQQEVEKFLKNKDVDYIFAGDITEAKIIKTSKKGISKKDIGKILNFGSLGEDFVYVGKVKVRGKLYSIAERKIVWQGEGRSNFLPNSRYATTEIILVGALHNAIGYMLNEMTGVFNIKIKELE
ncbi:MAG: hypothetical protein N2999_03475 [Proteobacteria bacterium]|nr:hypothetical protein [Pseudomonadota bacterium]